MGNIKTGENNPNYRHGLQSHPLYAIHSQMKGRCTNELHPRYHDYGGRGISVCKEWAGSFIVFYNWAISNGWAEGLQLDRIDNNGSYTPINCRFVSKEVNARNKRNNINIEYLGEKKTLAEWASLLGLNYSMLLTRIRRHNPTAKELFEIKNRYHKFKSLNPKR